MAFQTNLQNLVLKKQFKISWEIWKTKESAIKSMTQDLGMEVDKEMYIMHI